jgi:hypothetical protein
MSLPRGRLRRHTLVGRAADSAACPLEELFPTDARAANDIRRQPRNSGTLDAVNRRGKSIRCRVSCSPPAGSDGETRGVILLMDDHDDKAAPPAGGQKR